MRRCGKKNSSWPTLLYKALVHTNWELVKVLLLDGYYSFTFKEVKFIIDRHWLGNLK